MEGYILVHSGTKGMHWGLRRFQNPDGTWTPLGKLRRRESKLDLRTASNDELADATKRLQAENKYIEEYNKRYPDSMFKKAAKATAEYAMTEAGKKMVNAILGIGKKDKGREQKKKQNKGQEQQQKQNKGQEQHTDNEKPVDPNSKHMVYGDWKRGPYEVENSGRGSSTPWRMPTIDNVDSSIGHVVSNYNKPVPTNENSVSVRDGSSFVSEYMNSDGTWNTKKKNNSTPRSSSWVGNF